MLGGFTKAADCGVHSNRSRQQLMALKLWLKLLIGISYHKDGQDQILCLKDILDYLCDLYEHLEGIRYTNLYHKEGYVFSLVAVSILPLAEFEINGHWEDARHCRKYFGSNNFVTCAR